MIRGTSAGAHDAVRHAAAALLLAAALLVGVMATLRIAAATGPGSEAVAVLDARRDPGTRGSVLKPPLRSRGSEPSLPAGVAGAVAATALLLAVTLAFIGREGAAVTASLAGTGGALLPAATGSALVLDGVAGAAGAAAAAILFLAHRRRRARPPADR